MNIQLVLNAGKSSLDSIQPIKNPLEHDPYPGLARPPRR
jgi:hypothetical protein